MENQFILRRVGGGRKRSVSYPNPVEFDGTVWELVDQITGKTYKSLKEYQSRNDTKKETKPTTTKKQTSTSTSKKSK